MVSAGHVASVAVAAVATVLLDPSTEAGACAKLLNRANQATGKVAQPLIDAAEPLVGQAFELAGPYLVGASHLFYNVLFLLALVHLLEAFRRTGVKGLAGTVVRGIRLLPGVNELILFVLKGEISSSLKELTNDTSAGSGSSSTEQPIIPIPEKGLGREETLRIMDAEQKGDGDHCHEGRAFAFSYFNDAGRFEGHTTFLSNVYARFAEKAGLPDSPKNGKLLDELSQAVFHRYAHGNALNPLMFPTLRKYETEVLSMAANMLHGDQNVVGALTSGGTESILMTIKTYRERARALFPHITQPEILCPITIHPAFEKAGHYFDVKVVHAPVNPQTKQVDVKALEALISPNTIAICVSAPQYCHCVIDPVEEVSKIAQRHGLPLHVDACYGGFILPWIEKIGYKVPTFDFRVEGVTSITADCHKYGYAPKGASCVLYRNEALRRYMYYAYVEWPGGLYVSPSMAGTRPGANIAMAWATLMSIGQDGYCEITKAMMDTTEAMKAGIQAIDGLEIVGDPVMTGFAFQSVDPEVNILAVADVMETKGWKMERQSNPPCLHCSIMPAHANMKRAKQFVQDARDARDVVRSTKKLANEGTAAMYGMIATIPDNAIISDFLIGMFNELYKSKPRADTK
eukprot:INCI6050.5.p1 GENE.INCI6050.5~~INCI6050.5.p1  ORF type:complete len:630 (+),score=111.76 INCI6050.5:85-1974(+)